MVMESIEWFGCVEPEDIKPIIKPTRLARSTLRSALLVNKAWAVEAISILWRIPPVTALAAIKDRDRRQFYACHVRKLDVRHHECEKWLAEYLTLSDVELPLLKFIDIDEARELSAFDMHLCLECCIRPSLEVVRFEGFDLDSEILYLLRIRCPNLKKIVFLVDVFYGKAAGISALAELIDSCKSLRSIIFYSENLKQEYEFDIGYSGGQHEWLLAIGSLLGSIAHCNGLEELKLNTIHEHRTFSGVLKSLEQPFNALRCLWMGVGLETRSVSLLVSKLNPHSLTSLRLSLVINGITSTINPLPQIGLLVNLQQLSLNYMHVNETERGFHPSDMFPLKNLKRLRSLKICGLLFFPELTDEVFTSMVENWPGLLALELDASCCKLSTIFLTSLGKLCPRLVDLVTVGEYDLNALQNIPRPVFPQLECLILFGLVDRDGESQ